MRTFSALLLAALVGGGLAWLLLRGDAERQPKIGIPTESSADELEENPHLLVRTGNLTVRVRAPDGRVPFGAEVGYRHRGKLRLLYAGEDGTRQFADAPLGELTVLARAEGYEEATQPRRLQAGIPMEVPLTLRPLRDE